jgi:hypothetical protein
MNGRVPAIEGVRSTPYNLFDDCGGRQGCNSAAAESLRGIQQQSPLSDLFFSRVNVDALQQGIRYKVYTLSANHAIIGRQSDTELEVIMRSIFLQHGNSMRGSVIDQVRGLNEKVLDFSVPLIVRELQQYSTYRNDISALPVPMDRQQNVSSAGEKFLLMKEF